MKTQFVSCLREGVSDYGYAVFAEADTREVR